jgi:Ribbon-helix-helix protein, copG family
MIGWLDDDPVDGIDDVIYGPDRFRACHTCYHTCVHKTTVYLPDALKRRLAQAARRRGQSEAELIRAAIERLLAGEAPRRPTLPLFRSGDPTLAEHVDEALAGFGE